MGIRRLAFLCVLIAGCATTQLIPVAPEVRYFTEPEVGDVQEAELGETIVRQYRSGAIEKVALTEAHHLDNRKTPYHTITDEVLPDAFFTLAGETLDGSKIYQSDTGVLRTKTGDQVGASPTERRPAELIISREGEIAARYMNGVSRKTVRLENASIETGADTTITDKYFRQELVYNGRTDRQVQFIYREFVGTQYYRPAFSQEVQYDLVIGDTLGFKGARFRLLEASNTGVRYEVLRYFEDVE